MFFCLRRNRHLLHTQAEADIQLARRKEGERGGYLLFHRKWMITPCPTSKASYPLFPPPLSLAPASDKSEGCNGMPGPRRGAARWRRPAYLATPRKHKMTHGRHRLIWQPCLLRNQLVPARVASSPLLRAMSINGSGQPGRARPQINFSRTPNNLACT